MRLHQVEGFPCLSTPSMGALLDGGMRRDSVYKDIEYLFRLPVSIIPSSIDIPRIYSVSSQVLLGRALNYPYLQMEIKTGQDLSL